MKHAFLRRTLLLLVVLTLMMGSSVFAFSDLPEGESQSKLEELKRMGIVSGTGDDHFLPNAELTNAQAVAMLVKGFDMSLDRVTVLKPEDDTPFYDTIPEDAWYADSFNIAAHYGWELPRDIDPDAAMSKAAFVHYLLNGLQLHGPFPVTKRYYIIEDEDEINEAYKNSIQTLLNTSLISLDEEQRFHPTQAINRLDAAVLLYDSLSFIEERQKDNEQGPIIDEGPDVPEIPEQEEEKPLSIEDDVSYNIEQVNEEVNKVVVDWGAKPHPGYGVAITSITFEADTAIVHYDRMYPDPDKMYLQVISYPQAETFVSSQYTIELEETNTEDQPR